MNLSGGFIMEVCVLVEVGTVTGRLAHRIHLFDETTLHEGIETVIDRSQGDCRHHGLHAVENFLRCGVIAFAKDHLIDHFSLRGGAEATMGKTLSQGGVLGVRDHRRM
jgi:hypothetical protein